MGRYFGIANRTKSESISSYWKSCKWCDCHEVMHQFHWDQNDKIHSSCYDSYYEFEYDPKTNSMICTDNMDLIMRKCDDVWDECESDDENDENDENKNKNTNNIDMDNVDDIEITRRIKQPFKKYGFDKNLCANKNLNHVPVWNGNKCMECGYMYNESLLGEYAKNFNPVYYMN